MLSDRPVILTPPGTRYLLGVARLLGAVLSAEAHLPAALVAGGGPAWPAGLGMGEAP